MGVLWCILIGYVLYIPKPTRTEICEAEDEYGMTYYHYCSDACCDYTSPPACCESEHYTAYKNDYGLRAKRAIRRVQTAHKKLSGYYTTYRWVYYTTYRWVYYTTYYTKYYTTYTLSRGAITGIVFGAIVGLIILCMLIYGIGALCYKAYEKCKTCCKCRPPCKRHVDVSPINEINTVSHRINLGIASGAAASTTTPVEIPDIPNYIM
ncbi:uncharacterized protein [Argopecten irradians]|uniref:uncharacterized protein n=1 Tax=Argopecten irradians TaxID=31199 RepID=UPI00371D570A